VGKILRLDEVKSTKAKQPPQILIHSAQVMMNRTLTKLLDNGVDSDPSHENRRPLEKTGR
jgi:hypothetical protein